MQREVVVGMESAENTKPNHCHSRLGCGSAARRHIAVHATGEVNCPPDQMQFIISVRSCKGSVEGAQSSVQRRTEYITQVLRNNGIQEKCIKWSSEMRREESVSMQTDVLVQSDDLLKCETVRNLLIEKLDPSVQFGPITYHHTPENKDVKRQEAFKKAVGSAKAKAQCIAQTVGVQLGPALEVTEASQDVIQVSDSMEVLESQQNRPCLEPLHQKYTSATLTYSSEVAVTFEAQPLRTCSHKKCKKH